MNKKFIIAVLIIIAFLISCLFIYTNTNKEEYNLIEITGEELLNTIFENNEISITFALYNEYDLQSEQYLSDLKKLVNQAHENIYYVNTTHTSFFFEETFSAVTTYSSNILSYYAYQNGKIVVNNTYTNYNQLYKDLNGKRYNTKINKLTKEEKNAALKNAQELYKEGKISEAYNELANAWDTKEAKEEYENNPYYKIIGSWSLYEVDDDMVNAKYYNFSFMKFSSTLYTATKKDKIDGFKKPGVNDYTQFEILIKDNYIYIKDEKTNKYKKKYEIIYLEKYELHLKDDKKTYKLQYGA